MRRFDTKRLTRRRFLLNAAMATGGFAAGPVIITSAALGAGRRPAASERITMGAIGIGGRGRYDMGAFMTNGDVQFVAVCDVARNKRNAAKAAVDKKYRNRDCATYRDLRELLQRSDISAVLIATGDNWHSTAAILAARAGKDMYCEKPMSVTITEGRAVADTMRRHARIFQCGTQRRNVGHFQFAVSLARSGKLGELRAVHAEKAPWWVDVYETTLPPQPEPAREVFDWDMWLGPAPWRPYNSKYPSRGFWGGHLDFAGGSLTEWGSHTVDLCQWAAYADDTSPVYYEPVGKDVVARYAGGMKLVLRAGIGKGSCGVRFEGDEGWVQVDDSGSVETHPKSLRAMRRFGTGYPADDHVRNFLDCVKTRQQPVAGAEGAHRSITACHAANICQRLGRPLEWDPAKEEFIGDEDANRMRARAMRAPWYL